MARSGDQDCATRDRARGRDRDLPLLVHTHPDETVRTAIEIMREYGVSQLPVVKAEPPVASVAQPTIAVLLADEIGPGGRPKIFRVLYG